MVTEMVDILVVIMEQVMVQPVMLISTKRAMDHTLYWFILDIMDSMDQMEIMISHMEAAMDMDMIIDDGPH